MIKSCTDVATSLGTILTLHPTPSVLSAALSNNRNVLVFYILANNLLWHNKQPRMTYNIRGENSECLWNLVSCEFRACSEFSSRMLYGVGHSWLFVVPKQVISQDVENQDVESAAESTDRVGQRISIVPRLVATSVRDLIMQLCHHNLQTKLESQ